MGFYGHLGVKRVINCYGTYTLIGGHTFSDHVRAAMDEADRGFAWLWELEEKADTPTALLSSFRAVLSQREPAPFTPRARAQNVSLKI